MPSLPPQRIEVTTRAERLARVAWALLTWVLIPVYLAKLWWRGRVEPGYRQRLAERLGWGYAPRPSVAPLWVHAVSLGETKAASALIAALRAQQPGRPLLLTHGTATGMQAGADLLQPGDVQTWLPWDSVGATRRFFRHWQPAVGVLMETEIWPNLLHAARAQGVPMVLANARLSERSERKGARLSALLRPAASCLNLALAQSDADAQRLLRAGVKQVQVSGNLKYDLRPDAQSLAAGLAWRAAWAQAGRTVWVVANTREGEEADALAAWLQWRAQQPAGQGTQVLLALVPRHPQRFDAVAKLLQAQGLRWARRSDLKEERLDPACLQAEVFLGDSLGEMARYYGMAQLAVLGGSFAPLGGHNLIESAACGVPIVLGPSVFNFAEAAEWAMAAGAAWQVTTWQEAFALCGQKRLHSDQVDQAAAAAAQFAATHRGAAERMAHAISGLLPALGTH